MHIPLRNIALNFWIVCLGLAILFPVPVVYSKEKLVGISLKGKVPVKLGKDLGFGKKYRLSMANNFQRWGVQKVSSKKGFPVRLGDISLRFETREGVCGWDGKVWNDCKNGRSRHELSTAVYSNDPWNRERWYALSLYLPKGFKTTKRIGTTLFQFLAGGKPNWSFKYHTGEGLFVQREFKYARTHLIPPSATLNRWNDFVIRIKHSKKKNGALTVWINGKRAFTLKGATAKNVRTRTKPYFKFGIYNTGFGSNGAPINGRGFSNGKGLPNLVSYFDEVRAGKSCKSLKLADLGYDCVNLSK